MQVLLQYQSKSYYIIGQEVYFSIGRFYYIIGRFLFHYRARITVSGVYYIIGWYNGSISSQGVLGKHNQVERGSSMVECRTRNQVSPGSNPSLLPFRILGIFVLSIDAPVHSAV